jgi:hypothetical protein
MTDFSDTADISKRQLAAARRILLEAKEEHERLRFLDARKLYMQVCTMHTAKVIVSR